MFDTGTTITIGLRTAGGKTDVTVRWPSDEEWAAHRKRRRLLQRQLGRGATETEIETSEADSKLYEAIKLNGAPPLSAAEAGKVVETIALCDVIDVRLNAEDAEVDLQTLMGPVKHTAKIPTMDQARACSAPPNSLPCPTTARRSAPTSTLPHRCGTSAAGARKATPGRCESAQGRRHPRLSSMPSNWRPRRSMTSQIFSGRRVAGATVAALHLSPHVAAGPALSRAWRARRRADGRSLRQRQLAALRGVPDPAAGRLPGDRRLASRLCKPATWNSRCKPE